MWHVRQFSSDSMHTWQTNVSASKAMSIPCSLPPRWKSNLSLQFFRPGRVSFGLARWRSCSALLLAAQISAQDMQPLAAREELPSVAQIESFFDGLMAGQMNAHRVPGGVVALVARDRLVLAKGYGFADVAARTPVKPETTLFGLRSVSKLFVWTAVMQLAAEGKLDLDADVNRYLKDLRVPTTFPQPITMKHLMAHTAGFEFDRVIGGSVTSAAQLRPLAQAMKQDLPARVRPPGQVASYSNYGVCLAAYIVEQLSGQSWDDYVEQRILRPLAMSRTSFRQPLPGTLIGDAARPYALHGVAYSTEYFHQAPVGSAFTTAVDMAKFMQMHLNFGRSGGPRVLDEATSRQMQSVLFQPGPEVNAVAYGFYEMNLNGHRVIGLIGAATGFYSLVALLPQEGIGLFLAFNGDGGEPAMYESYETFMNAFFPGARVASVVQGAEPKAQLQRFAGQYRSARYSHTTYAKMAVLVVYAPVRVTVTGQGKLTTSSRGRETVTWVQTGKLSFREEHGHGRIAFCEDDQGNITHLLKAPSVVAFERIGMLDNPVLHVTLALTWFMIMAGAFVGWPVAAWTRWRRNEQQTSTGLIPGSARFLCWFVAAHLLLFVILSFWVMLDPFQVRFGTPPALSAGFWLVRMVAVLAVVLLGMTGRLWSRRQGQFGARLGFTLVVAACWIALWQLYYWRGLTWPF